MTTRLKHLLAFTLAGILGATGYLYLRGQAQQTAILARMAALEPYLAASNQERAQAASRLLFNLNKAVSQNRAIASDVAVLRQAQQIRARTQALLDTLHQLRLTGPASSQLRRHLPASLTHYTLFIRHFLPNIAPIGLPTAPGESPSWAALPAPAGLAFLTKLETEIRQAETEALTKQALKVVNEYGYDHVGALAVPASATVAAGAVYQAHLLLVLAGSGKYLPFSAEGQALPLDPATGYGLVRLQVPAARPGQPDTVRAEWRGQVQLPGVTGDTLLRVQVPYLIVKPVRH
jgi:hypothetical protein